MDNKKTRLIALLLAANLLTFGAAPTILAAGENDDAQTEASQQVNKSYKLCTEQVTGQERTVRAYLQLDAAAEERVLGYQITLRLTDAQGSIVPGREAEFKFDNDLNNVKIKNATFDKEKQLLQIYVASDSDFVQIYAENPQYNMLPVGTITIPEYVKADGGVVSGFRVLLDGPTGNTAFAYSDYTQYDVQYTAETNDAGEQTIVSEIIAQGDTYFEPESNDNEMYAVTVEGDAVIDGTEGTTIKVEPRSVVTVRFNGGEDAEFSHCVDGNGNIMSTSPVYKFAVTGNIKLTAVTKSDDQKIKASVSLTGSASKLTNGKYRLSYNGNCVLPEGCKMKSHGIIYTNKSVEDVNSELDNFTLDGETTFKIAKCAVSGTKLQFTANVNNVAAGGQIRTARAYMTYNDGNEDITVYSDPCQLNTLG